VPSGAIAAPAASHRHLAAAFLTARQLEHLHPAVGFRIAFREADLVGEPAVLVGEVRGPRYQVKYAPTIEYVHVQNRNKKHF